MKRMPETLSRRVVDLLPRLLIKFFCMQWTANQYNHSSISRLLPYHCYNTPPCEAPMPFSIRPYSRFPVQCSVTYNAGPFFKLPLAYFSGFWILITLLVLSSGSGYAEWVSIGSSGSGGGYTH